MIGRRLRPRGQVRRKRRDVSKVEGRNEQHGSRLLIRLLRPLSQQPGIEIQTWHAAANAEMYNEAIKAFQTPARSVSHGQGVAALGECFQHIKQLSSP
jgi:hypothetical protein